MEGKKKQPLLSKSEALPDIRIGAVLKTVERLYCSQGEQIKEDPILSLMIERYRATLAASRR